LILTLAERFEKEMFMVADSDGLSVGYRDDSRCAFSPFSPALESESCAGLTPSLII
jgi:hypothetical protein